MGMSAVAGAVANLPAGDQTVWAEATGFISTVCSDLDVGELIHGENFSLFEAMSALEIMDPKMDAGMATTGFKTAEEAINSGAAPVNLDVSQIIDVMDHLLACEEEEIFTVAFGLPLEESDSKSLATLNAVEELVARQLRGSKTGAAKKKASEEVDALQESPALEEEYCKAVLCRMRFRKALHHIFLYMDKPQGRGLEMARKHIAAALVELANIQASSTFLSSQYGLVSGATNSTQSTASGRAAIGFDVNVNRRLLAPTPPRSIKILSWEEVLAYFEHLLNDLHHICSVPLDLGLEPLLHFLVDFQKSHPDLVARARLQLLLVQDGKIFGYETIATILYKTMNLQHDAFVQTSESEVVFQQAGRLTLSLVRLLCTNPAWQRRKLGKMLQDWSNFLQQAEILHGLPSHRELLGAQNKSWWKDNVLVGWAAEEICWVAAQFLLGGFELELYSPNEYCMIYWYLDHVLRTLLHCKVTKEKILFEKEQSRKVFEAADSAKKKGKKKKGLIKGAGKEIRLSTSILLLQCHIDLCSGFVWMLTALTEDQKIVHRKTNLNAEQERFFQRFELLHKVVVPEPMMYYHFKDATRHRNFSVRQVYQMSYDHFMDVSQHLQDLGQAVSRDTELSPLSRDQKLLEIRQMEQVALRNRLALQIALQAGSGETLKVSFEFSQHPCFAVAVVKKSG
ncbi:hypothetical protein O6H91_06G120600 [Diphasiastrum complanatum]|uniref:Uncharacterized protein n=1 Tax=Diphasiastrum complanatum TaxID=34168 RepID=A0ACC2DIF7_DIPCM|nr:hypothetical protein O6H91_06G120600 [Diphasiastrum complanatum]